VTEVKLRPVAVAPTPPPDPNAKKGGLFVQPVTETPPDMGMWESAVGSTIGPVSPAYDGLLELNSYEEGKPGQILPNIAYDWWTDQAGTTWTFLLHKGVKFHDNTEMTCADVKFMLDTIRDGRDSMGSELRRSPRATYIRRVSDVSCPDNYTVLVKTDGPMNSLPATLASVQFAPMPKARFEGKLGDLVTEVGPAAGPFVFSQWIPGESLQFKRNANYWNQPYPYIDEIHTDILGSNTAVTAAVRVGRSDFVPTSNTSLPRSVYDPLAKEGKIVFQGLVVEHGFTSFTVNWLKAPWNDKRFAMAVRCAIDNKKAIATGEDGHGFEGPMLPLASDPGGSEWALTREQWKAIGPCYGLTEDTDMAQRQQVARDLLAQMGFSPSNPAKPAMPLQSGISTTIWPSVQADLKAVGIDPVPQVMTYAQALEKASAGEFDIYSHGYQTARHDPDQWFYELFYGTSDRNYGKYVNPEMEARIDAMSRESDQAKRRQMVNDIERQLLLDNAIIMVRHSARLNAWMPWVHNFYLTMPTNQQNRLKFTRTWIDQAMRQQMTGR
jgi:peptide/nickel transport system substrate-binding protein